MRARARRGRAVVTAFSMGFCSARSAHAQGVQGESALDAGSPSESRRVDVTIVAGGDDADFLLGTIRELLGRLGLGVDAHLVAASAGTAEPAEPPEGLSVSIDLASRYEAVTIVRRGRAEVRRTIARDSSPSIVREEIGEAVRSGVEAQLQSVPPREVAPPPAAASPPPSAPPASALPATLVGSEMVAPVAPRAAASRWWALDLTLLAGGGPVATGSGIVPRIGAGAVIASRLRLRPSLTVTAEYYVPFDPRLSNVDVIVRATFVSLRAVPAIEVLHASWIAVNLGAGGGVDVISVEPSAPPATANLTAIHVTPTVSNRVDPIVTALATTYVALVPGVAFTLVAGADVDFVPPEYTVGGPGGGDILTPWRVRPVALAGFTFTAVGSELFAARAQ